MANCNSSHRHKGGCGFGLNLLDKFLVVFESNFNRAVWAYTRLKEVAERERAGSGGRESVGYNFWEADSLRLIANHLVQNYLSNFIYHFAPRNNFLHTALSLVYHLTTPDSFYISSCFCAPSTPLISLPMWVFCIFQDSSLMPNAFMDCPPSTLPFLISQVWIIHFTIKKFILLFK